MKTIKIIDLLNKANNGEIIKKIKYNSIEYEFNEDENDWFNQDKRTGLLDEVFMIYQLNEEVEIIEEEKEIEKLDIDKNDISYCEGNMKTDEDMVDIFLEIKDKINELIDVVNEMRKEK